MYQLDYQRMNLYLQLMLYGGGDIDKGAEVMENMMENLEKGGKVSEESQGLKGARDMFATAQRLEGVL